CRRGCTRIGGPGSRAGRRALSSCSLPPPGMLDFFAIVVVFLVISGYVNYKAIERRAEIGARVFAVPLALAAAFLLFAALSWRRRYWTTRRRAATHMPPSSSTSTAAEGERGRGRRWERRGAAAEGEGTARAKGERGRSAVA
ncbi:unnamed protein product, partial [Urochloa humidicola]